MNNAHMQLPPMIILSIIIHNWLILQEWIRMIRKLSI